MIKFRCFRCSKIFKSDKKLSHNNTNRRVCPECRKPRFTNKGRKLLSPKRRIFKN